MAVPSTICGKVVIGSSDFAHITAWRFSKSGNVQVYNDSSSEFQLTLPGHLSGEVSFDCLYDPADDIYDRIKVNDQVTLLLYVDGSRNYSVPCRITDMDDEVNVQQGSPPTVGVRAQTHGAWTYIGGDTAAGPC